MSDNYVAYIKFHIVKPYMYTSTATMNHEYLAIV